MPLAAPLPLYELEHAAQMADLSKYTLGEDRCVKFNTSGHPGGLPVISNPPSGGMFKVPNVAAHSALTSDPIVHRVALRPSACSARPRSSPATGALRVFDYFGTPTNRAPVTLPSSPMSGS